MENFRPDQISKQLDVREIQKIKTRILNAANPTGGLGEGADDEANAAYLRRSTIIAKNLTANAREKLETLAGKNNTGALQTEGELLATLSPDQQGAYLKSVEGLSPKQRGEIAQTLLNPSSIIQPEGKELCGPTLVEIMLAKSDPVEYVRIKAELLTKGKVTLKGGQELKVPPNWDGDLKSAFANFAAGGYDTLTDKRADGRKGLYADEMAFLQEQVTGRATDVAEGNSDETMDAIATQANSGKPVSVLIKTESGQGHYVQVTEIKDGKITFIDPRTGKPETVDESGFKGMVQSANIEDTKAPTKLRKTRPTEQSGMLGGCGIVKAIVNAVKSVVKAVVSVVKAVVNTVISAAKVMVAVYTAIAKVAIAVVKTTFTIAGKLITGDFKGALAAAKSGIMDIWEEVKMGAKDVWEKSKAAMKDLGKLIGEVIKLAECTVPGFKLLTDFMQTEIGQKIMMGLGILAMIPPLTAILGPVMLAYALYQGTKMLGAGLENGNLKMAVMGALTVASSLIGLGAATKALGTATSATLQKGVSIASGAMRLESAIVAGDIKGAILAGASVAGSATGSTTIATVANTATKGVAAVEAVKSGDWLAAGAAIMAVGAAGLALASMDTDDSKPKSWIGQKYEDVKNWVGEKFDALANTGVGKAIGAGVDWVKTQVNNVDEGLFGTHLPDGTRARDGLVTKAGDWMDENIRQPVANAFAPVKETLIGAKNTVEGWFAEPKAALAGASAKLDSGISTLKQPFIDASASVDKGADGVIGKMKDGLNSAVAPVKAGLEKGAAAARDGAQNLANRIKDGPEPAGATTPGGTAGPGEAVPGGLAAPPAEKSWFEKAGEWIDGKAGAAQTNANNLIGKADNFRTDAARVQNDLQAKLDGINKAHDTFMAGVDTVRAVGDGDLTKALRSGSTVAGAAGYKDMSAGMNDAANKIDAGKKIKKGFEDGDVGGTIAALGDLTGTNDISATGRKIQTAEQVKRDIDRGDTAAAIYNAGNLTDMNDLRVVGNKYRQAENTLAAIDRGNIGDAVFNAGRLAGSDQLASTGQSIEDAEETKRRLDRGDTSGALKAFGRATGNQTIGKAGTTLGQVEDAQYYADRGDIGMAINSAGAAAGNKDIETLGERTTNVEAAKNALEGKDRWGNKLTATERAAGVMDNLGKAVDSNDLRNFGSATAQAGEANEAIERGDQVAADRAAANAGSALGKNRIATGLNAKASTQESRERVAGNIQRANDEGRSGDAFDSIAGAAGFQATRFEQSQDAKDFELKTKQFSAKVDIAADLTHAVVDEENKVREKLAKAAAAAKKLT